ncbi:MAG: 50S ribosomal protein L1 [bacterium]|nr:50S ribosomal protein L1 [bacterium]
MSRKTKRIAEILKGYDKLTYYSVPEAIDLVLKNASAKFNETIELHIYLGIDPRKSDQNVRGTVVLPHGTGKDVKIIAFVKADKEKEALEAGAEIAGAEDLIAKVKDGFTGFDICVATPDMMGMLGKGLGKVLGPKMPNPKAGTVTKEIGKTVKELKLGKVQYRGDKQGTLHSAIGKKEFGAQKLAENLAVLLDAVIKAKPATAKGTYLKSVTLTSTMGPSVRIDPLKVPAFLQNK